MGRIGFLHTSPVHTDTFERLVAAADPTASTTTVVDEGLLDEARRVGPDAAAVRAGISAAHDRLVADGADVIVCTCSTIGAEAVAAGAWGDIDVIRVDRPMAEAAVVAGTRITVLATLDSTLEPTARLLRDVAAEHGRHVEVTMRRCPGAWEAFERGDIDGSLERIAAECEAAAVDADVIVLAQASMADAARRCSTAVPVLSSPALAVGQALATLGSARRRWVRRVRGSGTR